MNPILRHIESIDWITLLLFGSLLLIVIVKNTFYNRFINFIILPFNNKYIFMYNKKDKLVNWFHLFFTLFQVINLALFLYLTWKVFFISEKYDTLGNYMYPTILGSIIVFLALKIFLQLSNGFIFGSNKLTRELIFKKLSYLNYSGIVMFIANVILIYIIKDSKTVFYTTFILILLINIIGWVNVLRIHQKFLANNFIYFILYLCALEIAPWLILGSYLNN